MEGEVCCQADDACVFVDAMPLDDAKASISQATPGVTCHYLQEQSQFLARHPFIAQSTRGFRWIHVDGEHTGQSVINDLEIADHLLSDRGIAVFDDFLFTRLSSSDTGNFSVSSHSARTLDARVMRI